MRRRVDVHEVETKVFPTLREGYELIGATARGN